MIGYYYCEGRFVYVAVGYIDGHLSDISEHDDFGYGSVFAEIIVRTNVVFGERKRQPWAEE